MTSQEFFKQNKYVVIRDFLTKEIATLAYSYCLTNVQRVDYMATHAKHAYMPSWDGHFGDPQVPNTFYRYGDPLMDTIMLMGKQTIEQQIGMQLIPNYTYWRLYQHKDILARHIDRPSCEISATLCIGYNNDNVDKIKYPDYDWPLFVETAEEKQLPIHLKPGDMIIYRGCEIVHWREPFDGLNHAQAFMHYNDATGPYNDNYLDGRPIPGIPQKYWEC